MRRLVSLSLFPALALALSGCMGPDRYPYRPGPGPGDGGGLYGRGYVHFRSYPERGHGFCGWEVDYRAYDKMVAAVSESIHAYYGRSLCGQVAYVRVRSTATGREVRLRVVDQGGASTGDFDRPDQHIMDLSREAFDALDADGHGRRTGRIYVTWEIEILR